MVDIEKLVNEKIDDYVDKKDPFEELADAVNGLGEAAKLAGNAFDAFIVDGSITSDKIAANVITSGSFTLSGGGHDVYELETSFNSITGKYEYRYKRV